MLNRLNWLFAILLWAIILFVVNLALADGVLYGVITDSTGRGAAGVEIDITRCHCSLAKYPWPKPYATVTTMHHGGYDVCLPDDTYLIEPVPIGNMIIEPPSEIVTVGPCEAE